MDTISTETPVVPGLYFSSTGPRQLKVYYQPGHDGGGTWFGQEYVPVVADRYRKRFGTCFEWCSGPGYIGYGLLDHGQCDRLVLADYYEPVVAAARQTAEDEHNNIRDLVRVYQSQTIKDLPPSEPFDLVVGNPPHFWHPPDRPNADRLGGDPGWAAHQEFFANISTRLADDGIILLQENWMGSQPDTFEQWIKQGGLRIRDWWRSPGFFQEDKMCQIWYLEIEKAK